MKFYDTIVVGAGAAGLYFAAQPHIGTMLILEKTNKVGTKLLMSGSGQCNLTHGGNIKDFLACYGDKGTRIRTVLYSHNNMAVCDFFASLNVNIIEREDGKIFPASMDAHEVRDALLSAATRNGAVFQTGSNVTSIELLSPENSAGARYQVSTENGSSWTCGNLVIACGGCSYPTTGSDGSIFPVLQRDLNLEIIPTVPALTPVFIENYPFAELSGISFPNAEVTIHPGTKSSQRFTGSLLLTHRNLSGPVILNHSRFMKTGTRLSINYVFPQSTETILGQMKKEFSGSRKTIEHWMTERLGLPKRFCELIAKDSSLSGRRISTLSGLEMKQLADRLTADQHIISGLGSFKQAMATAGGIDLKEATMKTMESKKYPGLYFIGEVLDIDGDTGGYNLQFAFSSAAAAARSISG